MKYTVKSTPQFKLDYRLAKERGLDMGPLKAAIAALGAGEELPESCRDRALTGNWVGYRECLVQPERLLVYRIDGDVLVLTLIRTGSREELFQKEGANAMKPTKALRTLYRSPLKTAVTLLLLAAAAFLFLYNLGEYAVSDREYREARDKYQGVLTVEEQAVPANTSLYDFFLLTDETGRTETYGEKIWESDPALTYENNHQLSLGEDILEKLSALPHVSRVEKRYLTAGVSQDYVRMDTDEHFYPYYARCVLTATVKYRYQSYEFNAFAVRSNAAPYVNNKEYVILEDVEVLAGDPVWLMDQEQQTVYLTTMKEEYRKRHSWNPIRSDEQRFWDVHWDINTRWNMVNFDNLLFPAEAEVLQPGRRVLLVLRNNSVMQAVNPAADIQDQYPSGNMHTFDVGDDSLKGWWPYFTDITDYPENWLEQEEFADLRELIRVTNDDLHTFDVVYCDDMAAQRRAAEGRIVCDAGRFLTPEDAGQPVCVVSTDFLEMSGLKLGDSLTLDLGNYLSEQYAPLGAVAVTRGRQSTAFTRQTFNIVGAWRDLNEGKHVFKDRYWCWSNNAIFVPTAFLPECRNMEGHEFKPSEVSFIVDNAEEILPFIKECLPVVEEMGLSYVFSDGGWSQIGEDLMQSRSIALVKLLVFGGAAVFALVLTVWLFIGRKKREYAIYRALGMPVGDASMQLYVPFLVLGGLAAAAGAVAARAFSLRQLAASAGDAVTSHVPAGPALYILGTVGFLLVLAAFAWGGILLIRRRSVLELLQGEGNRRKVRTGPLSEGTPAERVGENTPYEGLPASSPREPARDLGGSRSTNWGGRYLRRLLGRNLGRSTLSLMLAALLAFAFGLVTVLRGIYAETYKNVEVKGVFSGGISYGRAQNIAASGYVRDPYYECSVENGMIEMEDAPILLVNRLDRQVTEPVQWLEGWNGESAMNTDEKVLVMYASHAERLGVSLGDDVRVNEADWWQHVINGGLDPLKPGETDMDRRDARRPFFKVVGIIQSNRQETTVFMPVEANRSLMFMISKFELDIAEYTLADYHRAAEFKEYVREQLDQSWSAVQFTMDTSYADRMYKIHRLIESLYPLAVAAALLLGGVLPGLIVLHSSKEISILRALGVRARECVLLYTLAEVLCALAGLVLGIALLLVVLHPELGSVVVPFALYVSAHLAACALGSGVFAWLCARKHVLEQLQARE